MFNRVLFLLRNRIIRINIKHTGLMCYTVFYISLCCVCLVYVRQALRNVHRTWRRGDTKIGCPMRNLSFWKSWVLSQHLLSPVSRKGSKRRASQTSVIFFFLLLRLDRKNYSVHTNKVGTLTSWWWIGPGESPLQSSSCCHKIMKRCEKQRAIHTHTTHT